MLPWASHEVLRVSVFDLPERGWDLGSMFFVADEIGDKMEEHYSPIFRLVEPRPSEQIIRFVSYD
jgi:hypothetical protein